MTKAKITVSLRPELVAHAERAVAEGRAASVSAYVDRALEQQAANDDLDVLLAEMLDATGGPLTDDEIAALDQELGY